MKPLLHAVLVTFLFLFLATSANAQVGSSPSVIDGKYGKRMGKTKAVDHFAAVADYEVGYEAKGARIRVFFRDDKCLFEMWYYAAPLTATELKKRLSDHADGPWVFEGGWWKAGWPANDKDDLPPSARIALMPADDILCIGDARAIASAMAQLLNSRK